MEQFIQHILAITPLENCEITGTTRDRSVKLPDFELSFYKRFVELYGDPRYNEEPNPTLLFQWALIDKYNLNLRLRVEITPDGIFRYKL